MVEYHRSISPLEVFSFYRDYLLIFLIPKNPMKTYDFYTTLKDGKYSTFLKLIRKGNFYILLDEEAFYFA